MAEVEEVDSLEEFGDILDATLKVNSSVKVSVGKKKVEIKKKRERPQGKTDDVKEKSEKKVEERAIKEEVETPFDSDGLDPEKQPYFPIESLPKDACFQSRRFARQEYLKDFLGCVDLGNGEMDFMFPEQSQDPRVPLKFPVLVRFKLQTNYQTKEEKELKRPIYAIIVGVGSDQKDSQRIYSYYMEGISFWNHFAHVAVEKDPSGKGKEIFVPFCTISALGRALYNNLNCNGWQNFVISDTTSCWHGHSLKDVRENNQKLGIEFENTLPEDVFEEWGKKSASFFNDGAMNLIRFVKIKMDNPEILDDDEGKGSDDEVEEDSVKVKKRKTKARSAPKKSKKLTRREQLQKALNTSSADLEDERDEKVTKPKKGEKGQKSKVKKVEKQQKEVEEEKEEEQKSGEGSGSESDTSSRVERPVVRDAAEKKSVAGKAPMNPPVGVKKIKFTGLPSMAQKGVKKPLLGYDPNAPSPVSSEMDEQEQEEEEPSDSDLQEDVDE